MSSRRRFTRACLLVSFWPHAALQRAVCGRRSRPTTTTAPTPGTPTSETMPLASRGEGGMHLHSNNTLFPRQRPTLMLANSGDPVPAGPASLQLEQRLSGFPKMIGLHISNAIERRFAKGKHLVCCEPWCNASCRCAGHAGLSSCGNFATLSSRQLNLFQEQIVVYRLLAACGHYLSVSFDDAETGGAHGLVE
jgi:hypothetical protein